MIARRLTSGRFAGPVAALVSGAVAAQAVAFAARPVLTRLFTPDEFGALTLFVTLAALLAQAVTGRYEDALVLPERDDEAASVLALALGLAGAGALVLLGIALAAPAWWAETLGTPAFAPFVPLVPLGVFLLAVQNAAQSALARADRFRSAAAAPAAQSAATVAVQLPAGLAGVGTAGLIGGVVVGAVAGAVVATGAVARGGWPWARGGRGILAMARRYRRFPFFAAPASLLNGLSSRAPVLLLAAWFGTEAVGQFGLAFGTLALPVGLVASAVGQVFLVRAAEAHRRGALGPLALTVHRRLAAFALFPAAVVAVAGPELFAFVFGAPWREAGVYARLVAPWVFFATVAPPLTRVFDVTERQRADLGFAVFLAATQLGALAWAGSDGGPLRAVAAAGLAGAVGRVFHIAWMLRVAGAPLGRAAADLGRHLALAGPALVPLAAAVALDASGPVVLGAAALGAAVYYVLAFWLDRKYGGPEGDVSPGPLEPSV